MTASANTRSTRSSISLRFPSSPSPGRQHHWDSEFHRCAQNLNVLLTMKVTDRNGAQRIDWAVSTREDGVDGLPVRDELRKVLTLTGGGPAPGKER